MESPITPKRRKVRKGTQSCWECKRRKTRCTFTISSEATCDGCRSRRTKCIGQEFSDIPQPPVTSGNLARLDRVEARVEQLSQTCSHAHSDMHAPGRSGGRMPDRSGNDPVIDLPFSGLESLQVLHEKSQMTGLFDQVSRALIELWPNQVDLDIVLSIPVDISVLSHGIICVPYAEFIAKKLSSRHSILQLPPQGSHPIFIARGLLMLATLLQGIPSCFAERLAEMTCDHHALLPRIIDTVGRLVTSNDEMVSSLEGIECLMIESMYRNNAGDLRRAWLTNRRAMNLAQLMELDKTNITTLSSMVIEESTRARIYPDLMWFRLVCSDRYLSLMLGLPQCSVEDVFASPKTLEGCTPLERLERLEAVAGGLILQRNNIEQPDFEATCRIDKLLQDAEALMPPQCWIMAPDPNLITGDTEKALEDTAQLTCHFTHYHLLVQLHLPYMLQPPLARQTYEYNKMTAANASRAILTQYLFFRKSTSSVAYCRGIDFIVFIASTTLCLAHIEARRQRKIEASDAIPPLQSLLHQRQSDRGLLESTLQIMQTMAQTKNDAVALKVTNILQPLLDIEADASKGGCYQTTASFYRQTSQRHRDINEVRNALNIEIPHFGIIKIEHSPPPMANSQGQSLPEEELTPESQLQEYAPGELVVCGPTWPQNNTQTEGTSPSHHYQINMEDVNSFSSHVTFPSFYPTHQLHHSIPEYLDRGCPALDTTSTAQDVDEADFRAAAEFDPSSEEWPLQSVDTTLFSSLIRGYVASSEVRPPSEL